MLWGFTSNRGRKKELSLVARKYEKCLTSNTLQECIRNAASNVEASGKPYELLALIGIAGFIDEELILKELSKSLSDEYLRERFPESYKIILGMARDYVGVVKILQRMLWDGVNVSKNVLISLLNDVKCNELEFLGKIINDLDFYTLSEGSLSMVSEFLEHVLSIEGCPEAKMEALRALIRLYSLGKLNIQDFRRLMKNKKIKVVIMRRSGKVEGVKVFMNGQLIAEGINDYIIELLSLAPKLKDNALAIS